MFQVISVALKDLSNAVWLPRVPYCVPYTALLVGIQNMQSCVEKKNKRHISALLSMCASS